MSSFVSYGQVVASYSSFLHKKLNSQQLSELLNFTRNNDFDADAYCFFSQLLLENNRLSEARDHILLGLKIDSAHGLSCFIASKIYYELGEYDASLQFCKNACVLNVNKKKCYQHLFSLGEKLKDFSALDIVKNYSICLQDPELRISVLRYLFALEQYDLFANFLLRVFKEYDPEILSHAELIDKLNLSKTVPDVKVIPNTLQYFINSDEEKTAEQLFNYAFLLYNQNQIEECYRFLVTRAFNESDYRYVNLLALLFKKFKLYKPALKNLNKALQTGQAPAEIHFNLGNLHLEMGNVEEAKKHYDTSYALGKRTNELITSYASVARAVEETDLALELLNEAATMVCDSGAAYRNLSELVDVEYLSNLLYRIDLELETSSDAKKLSQLLYSKYKIYERCEQYENAFKNLCEANSLRLRTSKYSYAEELKYIRRFSDIDISSCNVEMSFRKCSPIFIFGMPRSGSTLLEQMLSRHPSVTTLGELTFIDFLVRDFAKKRGDIKRINPVDLNNEYYKRLDAFNISTPYFTDKMPFNIVYYPLLRIAFPNAVFLYIERPKKQVCWSNFSTHFGSDGLNYSLSLADTSSFYDEIRNLYHSYARFDDKNLSRIEYQKLTENPDVEIRKILQNLGLPFLASCLEPEKSQRITITASQQQVKRSIRSFSSNGFLNYTDFLPDWFQSLN